MDEPQNILNGTLSPTGKPASDSEHYHGSSPQAKYASRDQESGSGKERCPALRANSVKSDAATGRLGYHSRHGTLPLAEERL
jgi:hypothetical protein